MLRTAVALLLALVALGAAQAGAQGQRIAGQIVAVDDTLLTVRAATGDEVRLRAPDAVRITARIRVDWSNVVQGSYVGTTAVPQPDGTLLAKEVHIFSEAQRGSGEGHRPMTTAGDTMTNATVASITRGAARPRDTVTNATVTAATGTADHRLTLTYKGGEKTVVVPDDAPIIASEPGDRALLVRGAHIVVYARRDNDGSLVAERISVGRNGFITPI